MLAGAKSHRRPRTPTRAHHRVRSRDRTSDLKSCRNRSRLCAALFSCGKTRSKRLRNYEFALVTTYYTFGHDEISLRVVDRDSGGTVTDLCGCCMTWRRRQRSLPKRSPSPHRVKCSPYTIRTPFPRNSSLGYLSLVSRFFRLLARFEIATEILTRREFLIANAAIELRLRHLRHYDWKHPQSPRHRTSTGSWETFLKAHWDVMAPSLSMTSRTLNDCGSPVPSLRFSAG